MQATGLTRFAWLSIGAAVATILLKAAAYFFTGSVGLLSDALESGVNLIAAAVALIALSVVARPPDDQHQYGHFKVEYFSSGIEGGLILFAATSIAIAAVQRILHPQPLEQVGVGIAISSLASLINLLVARRLLVAGKQHGSIALEADARHLMTDVWTSVGVVIGIAAVGVTGWAWLDPVIALAVALNIILSGVALVRRSVLGLIDTALPDPDLQQIRTTLDGFQQREGIQWHALRTRQAGVRRFMSVHILVPGQWTVLEGHRLLERIEQTLRDAQPNLTIVTHLEPQGDESAYADTGLVREEADIGTR